MVPEHLQVDPLSILVLDMLTLFRGPHILEALHHHLNLFLVLVDVDI
jgi:hypothetical protein